MSVPRGLSGGAALLALLGCGLNFDPQPNPTRFYLLSPLPADPVEGPGVLSGMRLGIGPIEYAPYVDQQKIVTRVAPNRVEFAEFRRWAEPFDRHFARILGEDLDHLTRPDSYDVYPWARAVDLRVEVVVSRFDRLPDGAAEIEVDWVVRDGAGEPLRSEQGVQIREPATTSGTSGAVDVEDSVLAMSAAVGRLAERIASAIADVDAGR